MPTTFIPCAYLYLSSDRRPPREALEIHLMLVVCSGDSTSSWPASRRTGLYLPCVQLSTGKYLLFLVLSRLDTLAVKGFKVICRYIMSLVGVLVLERAVNEKHDDHKPPRPRILMDRWDQPRVGPATARIGPTREKAHTIRCKIPCCAWRCLRSYCHPSKNGRQFGLSS